MASEAMAQMRTLSGEIVSLQSVSARGRLEGLLFELEVEQAYRNEEDANIEVVYTFPVPLRATLLDLELEIGDRTLKGVVVRRQQASVDYERAIDDGDTAVLLERSLEGAYTLSLGNLMAGERAVIRYRYAELVDSFRDCVRVRIPTVIAPWYGDPIASGLQPHQTWQNDPAVEYPLTVEVDIVGELATCDIDMIGQDFEIVEIGEAHRRVRASGRVFMDRDFTINLRGEITRKQVVVCRDGDSWLALASVVIPVVDRAPRPLGLKILLDCSGSMGGPGIIQAREALRLVLERLSPGDAVSFTRFGSQYEHLTPGMIEAEPEAIERLRKQAAYIEADLGGTEMATAVKGVLDIRSSSEGSDILMVTDGQVFDVEGVLARVARSKHRLFVVSVGAAPNESLGRKIAECTGGAWECVAIGEDATDAIVRMFKRLKQPSRCVSQVRWPDKPDWEIVPDQPVFGEDTIHLFGHFPTPPEGNLQIMLDDGQAVTCSIQARLAPKNHGETSIPRLAAGARIRTLSEADAASLALEYQLVSEHTSLVLVADRDEFKKSGELPRLRHVSPMLPAGWGGTSYAGTIHRAYTALQRVDYDAPSVVLSESEASLDDGAFENLVFHNVVSSAPERSDGPPSPLEIAKELVHEAEGIISVAQLAQYGVPRKQRAHLNRICREQRVDERLVVAVWIAMLLQILPQDSGYAEAKRNFQIEYLGRRDLRGLRRALNRLLKDVGPTRWTSDP